MTLPRKLIKSLVVLVIGLSWSCSPGTKEEKDEVTYPFTTADGEENTIKLTFNPADFPPETKFIEMYFDGIYMGYTPIDKDTFVTKPQAGKTAELRVRPVDDKGKALADYRYFTIGG